MSELRVIGTSAGDTGRYFHLGDNVVVKRRLTGEYVCLKRGCIDGQNALMCEHVVAALLYEHPPPTDPARPHDSPAVPSNPMTGARP